MKQKLENIILLHMFFFSILLMSCAPAFIVSDSEGRTVQCKNLHLQSLEALSLRTASMQTEVNLEKIRVLVVDNSRAEHFDGRVWYGARLELEDGPWPDSAEALFLDVGDVLLGDASGASVTIPLARLRSIRLAGVVEKKTDDFPADSTSAPEDKD